MMIAKHEVMNALQIMPENISFTEIKEAMEIIEANHRAMTDIRIGRVYTKDEAKRRVLALVDMP